MGVHSNSSLQRNPEMKYEANSGEGTTAAAAYKAQAPDKRQTQTKHNQHKPNTTVLFVWWFASRPATQSASSCRQLFYNPSSNLNCSPVCLFYYAIVDKQTIKQASRKALRHKIPGENFVCPFYFIFFSLSRLPVPPYQNRIFDRDDKIVRAHAGFELTLLNYALQ